MMTYLLRFTFKNLKNPFKTAFRGYVCWAFARAYAPDVLQPFVSSLAETLIQVAVFDREVNCRRAAAAAVQENVGRQGTVVNGIDVVTLADYWSLAARRQAYLQVAPEIAGLGQGTYRLPLMEHLVDRKLCHQDGLPAIQS